MALACSADPSATELSDGEAPDAGAVADAGADVGDVVQPPPVVVSVEHTPLPVVAVSGAAPSDQRDPAVAVGAGITLLAWTDNRGSPLDEQASDLYVARYDSSGALLDPLGLALSTTALEERRPRVAYGAGVFFVAWAGPDPLRSGLWVVRGARVTPDGTVLDPNGIELGEEAYSPAVAFAGEHFLVGFGGNYTRKLRVVPVSAADGSVGPTVVLAEDDASSPELASNGQSVLAAFTSEPSVTNRSAHLTLLDEIGNPYFQTSWSTPLTAGLAVAGGPAGFVVADQQWSYGSQWTPTVKLRRMGASGAWLDSGLELATWNPPLMARDGPGYLFAYANSGLLTFRIDDTAWSQTAPTPIAGSEGAYIGALASDGTTRVLAWMTPNWRDVRHTRLDAAGAALDPSPIPTPRGTSGSQVVPALGAAPGGLPVLAFCEASQDTRAVRYASLKADGSSVVGEVNEIPGGCEPQIAVGPTSTLMVWKEGATLRGGLIAPNGELGPVLSIVYTTSELHLPRLAATPGGFVVGYHGVTQDFDVTHESLDVVRLDAQGQVVDTISIGTGKQVVPIAVGNQLFAAWKGYSSLGSGTILAGPVMEGGGSPITVGVSADGEPISVASNNDLALIAWIAKDDYRVMASLVKPDGQIQSGPFPVSPSGHWALEPSVCFDGTQFIVVWRDLRTPWADLYGARVSVSGIVYDTAGAVISDAPGNELGAAVFPGATGQVLLGYSRLDQTLGAVRVHTRSLVLPGP